jgi:hypothetical protein
MKRNLLLAISVLALTAASQPLFAAEAETPAPRERAAPAAERAPARERQAAPARAARNGGTQQATQQSSSQPSQSTWTGSQAGGYGGGNAGGGSFADATPFCRLGLGAFPGINPSGPSGPACPPGPGLNFDLKGKVAGTGGASVETPKIPVGPVLVGLVADVFFGNLTASSTAINTYPTGMPFGPDPAGQVTTETRSGSLSERTNGSLRAKVGVPLFNYWVLAYFTAGLAVGKTEGSFTYTGSNFGPLVPGATNVVATASFSDTRKGFSGGGGAEFATGIPGLKFAIDYTYTNFGSFTKTVPLVVTSCGPGPGLCSNGQEVISVNNLSTSRVTAGIKFGL